MSKEPNKETIQAWIHLHRSHRLLLDKVENKLKNSKLPSLDWYDVLLELNRKKETGLRQYEIGEKVLLSKFNLSRLIDRLEKNQLVVRQPCDDDGRGNQIKITAEGVKVLKDMWPTYSQSIVENFGSYLDSNDCHELIRVLGKVLAG